MNTYEIKLKGIKEDEQGILKASKMKYIVKNAVSCADAENSALLESANILKDAEAISVQVKSIFDFFHEDEDRLWYVKVQETILDDLTSKEHKISRMYLVGAESAKEASNIIMKELANMDCEVVKISDSKVDVVMNSPMAK